MSQPAQMPQRGPPYLPTSAGLGGRPSKSLDIPVCAVFLVLFIAGAVCNMTILQINKKQGKKFLLSGMLFGFCMARITALTMRIVWTVRPNNAGVAIAAQVFVAAGVVLLFIANLIFTQRLLRASFPSWAWSKWFSWLFKGFYICLGLLLVAIIFCVVQSFYTLDPEIRRIDRDVQLVGQTYFAVVAFLPIPLLLLKTILKQQTHVEKFGEGRFRTKIVILVFTTLLLTFGAAFRCGVAYVPRPANRPAWYHSKACFYLVNFTIEIIVIALYILIRVDRRFIVPNGSHGPGDYLRKVEAVKETNSTIADHVLTEEEVFGDEGQRVGQANGHVHQKEKDLEANGISSDV